MITKHKRVYLKLGAVPKRKEFRESINVLAKSLPAPLVKVTGRE
jgi:hypothetical protein